MPRFTVIDGTPPPDTPKERVRARLRKTAAPEIIQCHRCGGREVIETKTGVLLKDGKATGGTKALHCANCWMKGERVVLL
jgi:transcription elongation factor Elf1